MRCYLLLITGMIFLASCVSNRKIMLMQKNDVNKKDLPKDTVMRTYALDTFQYKIQTNDIVYVQVQSLTDKEFDFFSNQGGGSGAVVQPFQLAGSAIGGELVSEAGDISLPVIGKYKIAGLTTFQAQDELQKLAALYIEAPIVKVRLLNYRATFLGEVAKEGVVMITNNRVSLIEAIALAGGFSEMADRSNIKLIRQYGSRTEVQYINLLDENFFNSPYYYVYQNDVIIVPPLRQRPFRSYFSNNLALFVSSLSAILLVITLTTQQQ